MTQLFRDKASSSCIFSAHLRGARRRTRRICSSCCQCRPASWFALESRSRRAAICNTRPATSFSAVALRAAQQAACSLWFFFNHRGGRGADSGGARWARDGSNGRPGDSDRPGPLAAPCACTDRARGAGDRAHAQRQAPAALRRVCGAAAAMGAWGVRRGDREEESQNPPSAKVRDLVRRHGGARPASSVVAGPPRKPGGGRRGSRRGAALRDRAGFRPGPRRHGRTGPCRAVGGAGWDCEPDPGPCASGARCWPSNAAMAARARRAAMRRR